MAVTITQAALSAALRLGDSAAETAEATRLLSYAAEAVARHVSVAPDAVHNESVVRLAAYLYDQPNAGRGMSYANAIRSSGASQILLPWRVHRAGNVAEAVQAAQQAAAATGNSVVDVEVSGSTLTVTFEDGSTRDEVLPEGMAGDVDQAARDSAGRAQAAADRAQAAADEPDLDQTARDAAAAAQAAADAPDVDQPARDAAPRGSGNSGRGGRFCYHGNEDRANTIRRLRNQLRCQRSGGGRRARCGSQHIHNPTLPLRGIYRVRYSRRRP